MPARVKLMTFLSGIYNASNISTPKQIPFWNPEAKLSKLGMFMKNESQNLAYLDRLFDLFSGLKMIL